MKLLILTLTLALISCGKADNSLTAESKNFATPVIDGATLNQTAEKTYGGTPISITAYRWPKASELTFPSVAFPSMSGSERVIAIADLVASWGPVSDNLDEKIYHTTQKKSLAIKEIKEEIGIEECWEAENPEQEEKCNNLYASKIAPIESEYTNLIKEKNSVALKITQEFDENLGSPTNWIKADSSSAVHDILISGMPNSKTAIKFGIVLKLLPEQSEGLLYSVDNGAIKNLEYRHYESNGATLLTFDLYEMSSPGVYTGNRYQFKLRSKVLPNVGMRLRGDFEVFSEGSSTPHEKGMYKIILDELK